MNTTRQIPAMANDLARAIVETAVKAAEQTEQRFTIAVVDAAGHLNAFARMDGAPVLTIQIAQDKAYTAAGFGMATDQWHDFIKNDPPLATGAPTGIDRLITFGGGIPITTDGHLIGGIGVSGGHWTDDMKIAEAGLTALHQMPSQAG